MARPLRAHFAGDLDSIAKAASDALYPANPTQPERGWGSISDDETIVNESSSLTVAARAPKVADATAELPRRLRLRYYYDERDPRLTRTSGTAARWETIHFRRAIDFVIFDGDKTNGFPVLAGIRNERTFNTVAIEAVRSLDSKANLESDTIPETLSPDFYQWLLLRLHKGGELAPGVKLESINEMSASDRLVHRGARFSHDAPLDRADMAALLAIGNSAFGPAKLALSSEDVDAYFIFELNLDGGFSVYRTSSYGALDYPTAAFGVALTEDLWWRVLPEIRSAYNADKKWHANGEAELKALALKNLADALGVDITVRPKP